MAVTLEAVLKLRDEMSKTLGAVEGRARGLTGAIGGVGGAMANMAKTTALALGGLGVAVGGVVGAVGFNFDNMKQQAQLAFETMLGSGEQAKAFLDDLQKFAAATPFEFPDLISASQKLLAMGFSAQEVLPTLTAIGDAVAGLGGGAAMVDQVTRALGQMKAKGKASAEEMLQLTEAGIPAWQFLADAIGTDVADAMDKVSDGAVDADTVISAVTKGMNEKFGGLMEKQSHTFGGLLSTLKDTFTQVSGTVMAPFFDLATSGMQKLVDLTSSPAFTAGVQKLAEALRSGLGSAIQFVSDAVGRIIAGFREGDVTSAGFQGAMEQVGVTLRNVFTFMRDELVPFLVTQVLPWLEDLGQTAIEVAAKVADFLSPALGNLRGLFELLLPVLEPVGKFLSDHKEIIIALAAAILLLTNPWLAVAAALVVVLARWEDIKTMFTQTIPDAIDAVITKIEEIPIIGEIFTTTLENVKAVVTAAFDVIKVEVDLAINAVRDTINIVLALIHGDFSGAWDGIKQLLADVWEAIKSLFDIQFGLLRDLIGNQLELVKGVFSDAFELIKSGVTGAFDAIKTWVRDNWPEIATLISGPFAPIVAVATDAFGVRSALEGAMASAKQFVSDRIDDIVGFFSGMPGRITTGMGDLATTLGAPFKAGLNAIIAAINSFIDVFNDLRIPGFSVKIPLAPDVHFSGFDFPDIPRLASLQRGGIVPSGAVVPALLHGPEAIIPLDRAGERLSTSGVLPGVGAFPGMASDLGRAIADDFINAFSEGIVHGAPRVAEAARTMFSGISEALSGASDLFGGMFDSLGSEVGKRFVSSMFSAITTATGPILRLRLLADFIGLFGEVFATLGDAVGKRFVSSMFSAITTATGPILRLRLLADFIGLFGEVFDTLGDAVGKRFASSMMSAFASGIRQHISDVLLAVDAMLSAISERIHDAFAVETPTMAPLPAGGSAASTMNFNVTINAVDAEGVRRVAPLFVQAIKRELAREVF